MVNYIEVNFLECNKWCLFVFVCVQEVFDIRRFSFSYIVTRYCYPILDIRSQKRRILRNYCSDGLCIFLTCITSPARCRYSPPYQTGVNFINVLRARFSYEILAPKKRKRRARKTLMKLTPALRPRTKCLPRSAKLSWTATSGNSIFSIWKKPVITG